MTFRVSYSLERLQATDAALSYVEHGALARLRMAAWEAVTLGGSVSGSWRTHREAASDPALLQHQRFFDLSLEAEWAFAPDWALIGSFSRRHVVASPEDYGYQRWVSSLGISYALAIF